MSIARTYFAKYTAEDIQVSCRIYENVVTYSFALMQDQDNYCCFGILCRLRANIYKQLTYLRYHVYLRERCPCAL